MTGPAGIEFNLPFIFFTPALRLISDVDLEVASPLVDAIRKDPLRLLAQSLHEQRALRFNGELGAWEWRPLQAAQAKLPDDLGALVTDRLRELSPAARAAVSTAACVGLRCELRLLAGLLQQGPGMPRPGPERPEFRCSGRQVRKAEPSLGRERSRQESPHVDRVRGIERRVDPRIGWDIANEYDDNRTPIV